MKCRTTDALFQGKKSVKIIHVEKMDSDLGLVLSGGKGVGDGNIVLSDIISGKSAHRFAKHCGDYLRPSIIIFDLSFSNCDCYRKGKQDFLFSSFYELACFRDGRLRVGDEILMVNSVGLLGMTLSDANKAIKKLPYGPIRVVYCSKLVSNLNFGAILYYYFS